MPPELIVRVIGDTSQLEKSFKRASKATGNLERDLGRTGRGVVAGSLAFKGLGRSVAFASGAFLGGAGLTAAVRNSITAASDLNEQIGKTQVVFGASAQSVLDWSKTTTAAFGESQRQALEAASSIGALLRPLGVTGQAAADQARKLTELGADLASFYNTDVADALAAIKSGLVGEIEPLRRYGVVLSEAAVQAEALTETHKKAATQLTAQDKVLARLKLIFQGTTQAQGDSQRSMNRLAEQTKVLRAQLDDLQTEIGKDLIPALTGFVKFINQVWIPGLHDAGAELDKLGGHFRSLADRFKHSSPLFNFSGLQAGKALVQGFKAGLGIESGGKDGGDMAQILTTMVKAATGEMKQVLAKEIAELNKPTSSLVASTLGSDAAQPQKSPAIIHGAEQRNAWFDAAVTRMLGGVQDIPTLKGQIARLKQIAAIVQDRIKVTKDITRRLNLGDQLKDIYREIRGDQDEIAANAKRAADAAKAAAKKRADADKAIAKANVEAASARIAATNDAARAQIKTIAARGAALRKAQQAERAAAGRREQARVFGILGLTATGDERAPSRGNLLADIKKAQDAITGTPLDTKAMRSRLAQLRQVLNTEFSKLTRDTKIRVGEWLDALTGRDKGQGPLSPNRQPSIKQLVHGTGLSGAGLRQLEFNLAGANLSAASKRVLHVHTTINLDGTQVARNTTEHQERDVRRRAYQTRGRQHR